MSLSGKPLKAILELNGKNISSQDGIKLIVKKLNILYKKHELHETFQDLESFEFYRRTSETNIQLFLIPDTKLQFQRTYMVSNYWRLPTYQAIMIKL